MPLDKKAKAKKVLILIVMDNGLSQGLKSLIAGCKTVLILIVMDNGLSHEHPPEI